jgi:hypothetical protein
MMVDRRWMRYLYRYSRGKGALMENDEQSGRRVVLAA